MCRPGAISPSRQVALPRFCLEDGLFGAARSLGDRVWAIPTMDRRGCRRSHSQAASCVARRARSGRPERLRCRGAFHPRPQVGSRRCGSLEENGREAPDDFPLERSRGGFGTNLHLVVGGRGIPLGALVTAGQRHESAFCGPLMDTVAKSRRRRTGRCREARATTLRRFGHGCVGWASRASF